MLTENTVLEEQWEVDQALNAVVRAFDQRWTNEQVLEAVHQWLDRWLKDSGLLACHPTWYNVEIKRTQTG